MDCRSCDQSSCKLLPFNGPFATTLCASGRSTISHDSPIGLFAGNFLSKSSASFRPPQIRSMKMGPKVRGVRAGLVVITEVTGQRSDFKEMRDCRLQIGQCKTEWAVHLKMRARRFVRYWMPTIVWMAVIFLGSTDMLSAAHTSGFLVPFLRWLDPQISLAALNAIQFGIRKLAHLTEYAILAALLWRALRGGTRWQVKMSILF